MHGIVALMMLLAAMLTSGCAGLEVTPIPSDAVDQQARGFRYYRPAPFLLVYTDNKGGLESKLIYLCDMTKKMSIRPYNYLASNKATLKFNKGCLTQAKAIVDETVIPSAVVSSFEKVATALVKAANAPGVGPELAVPAPYLFRIVKVGDKWTLQGGQGLDENGSNPAVIRVTVSSP